ncbi:hypothetical protein E2C01_063155 [Portunus trituberculatus]|uniref:Uncharacterized protein n=1 Tax=Portunus trituberculatus TaxID=210409 RepID=A0A5B7HFL4_PORTR|nr:hypothetical protein [Portunus trituberculatus]
MGAGARTRVARGEVIVGARGTSGGRVAVAPGSQWCGA